MCKLAVAHASECLNQRSPSLRLYALTIQPLHKHTPAGTVGSPVWMGLQIGDSCVWELQEIRKFLPVRLDLLDDLDLDPFSRTL